MPSISGVAGPEGGVATAGPGLGRSPRLCRRGRPPPCASVGRWQAGRVVFGLGSAAKPDPFAPGRLARALPPGTYALGRCSPTAGWRPSPGVPSPHHFGAYGKPALEPARLLCPADVDRSDVLSAAEAAFLAADLINTPAADLGPDELESTCRDLARRFKARLKVVKGTALQRDFPMIHAVGQASDRPPRLIDFTWGAAKAPKVTLWARGSASTPAASTSSRPPACS